MVVFWAEIDHETLSRSLRWSIKFGLRFSLWVSHPIAQLILNFAIWELWTPERFQTHIHTKLVSICIMVNLNGPLVWTNSNRYSHHPVTHSSSILINKICIYHKTRGQMISKIWSNWILGNAFLIYVSNTMIPQIHFTQTFGCIWISTYYGQSERSISWTNINRYSQ